MTVDIIHCILHNNDVIFAWTLTVISKGMLHLVSGILVKCAQVMSIIR